MGEVQDDASIESHLVCSFTVTFLISDFAHRCCLEQNGNSILQNVQSKAQCK